MGETVCEWVWWATGSYTGDGCSLGIGDGYTLGGGTTLGGGAAVLKRMTKNVLVTLVRCPVLVGPLTTPWHRRPSSADYFGEGDTLALVAWDIIKADDEKCVGDFGALSSTGWPFDDALA